MDKLTLKRLFAANGIPQVEFAAVEGSEWRGRCEGLGLPLWVKPSRLGSSVGITRVERLEDLDAAVELALRHDPRVIVEAAAAGREVECSVLGNDDPTTSLPGEIVANADWYDFEAKYTEGGMELLVPAPIAAEAMTRVRELAAEVFALAGCSGLARCDFFVEPDGDGPGQRDQHDARLHRDQRLREAARGRRPRLPRPLRPPRRRSRSSATTRARSHEF